MRERRELAGVGVRRARRGRRRPRSAQVGASLMLMNGFRPFATASPDQPSRSGPSRSAGRPGSAASKPAGRTAPGGATWSQLRSIRTQVAPPGACAPAPTSRVGRIDRIDGGSWSEVVERARSAAAPARGRTASERTERERAGDARRPSGRRQRAVARGHGCEPVSLREERRPGVQRLGAREGPPRLRDVPSLGLDPRRYEPQAPVGAVAVDRLADPRASAPRRSPACSSSSASWRYGEAAHGSSDLRVERGREAPPRCRRASPRVWLSSSRMCEKQQDALEADRRRAHTATHRRARQRSARRGRAARPSPSLRRAAWPGPTSSARQAIADDASRPSAPTSSRCRRRP